MTKFSDFPFCDPIKNGLSSAHFSAVTPVQASTIPLAIEKKDLWVTSPTGSGKTLCYLAPLLDHLHKKNWSRDDGLGALILVPTRELAVQVFDVLKTIGKFLDLSAGLLIGGKNFAHESKGLAFINILVATPGRLLHHLDKTLNFSTSSLQLFIIDEVDLLFELGFIKSTQTIVSSLPKHKQVMLFSATASPRVNQFVEEIVETFNCMVVRCPNSKDVSIHPFSEAKSMNNHLKGESIPKTLDNLVCKCDLKDKFTLLFSFLRKHTDAKILIFFSTCKEVRFSFESFCKLRPGIPICHIHGKQNQLSRTKTYYKFCEMKTGALFTTDVCSRGLDFPKIDFVVNFDCPDNFDLYVHRVGRSARYNSKGVSLLFLCNFETNFLDLLTENAVSFSPAKSLIPHGSLNAQLSKICSRHPEIKHLAEKSFISYLRSIYLLHGKDKALFDDLNLAEYSASLGLPNVPYIKKN